MNARHDELLIGVRDWNDPAWAQQYYPDSLPDDWRFCYYSNQFRSVLVPEEFLRQQSEEDIAGWAEDSDPAFYFSLELNIESCLAQPGSDINSYVDSFFHLVKPIHDQIAGVLLCIREPERHSADVRDIKHIVAVVREKYAVCLDVGMSDLAPGLEALAAQQDISVCWYTDGNLAPLAYGRFMCARSSQPDPKAQRSIIQQLHQWSGGEKAAGLYFEGPHAAESAQQARIICELTGV